MLIPEGESLPEGQRYITNSELQTFKACRRKWYLGYYLKLQPKRKEITGPAPIGTRGHSALESWYVPKGHEQIHPLDKIDIEAERDIALAYEQNYSEEEIKKLKSEIQTVRILIEGYLEYVEESGIDIGIEVIFPEARVTVPLKGFNNVWLLSKQDVKVRRLKDNAILFIDHKFTTLTFAQKLRNLSIDEQMKFYHLVNTLEGQDRTAGAIYNMIRINKRTAKAKPPFYMRVEQHYNKNTLNSFYMRTHQVVKEILQTEKLLNEGCDPLKICYPTPNSECSWKDKEYFKICPLFDDGSYIEDLLKDKYEVRSPLERYNS